MANKKLTPIQEAIWYLKNELQIMKNEVSVTMEVQASVAATITYLKSLLPKEKEFAREMWNEAIDYFSDTPELDKTLEFFDNLYQQYEQ